MGHARAGNYHANSQNHAQVKFVQDFMSVPVLCKFDKDPINKSTASGAIYARLPFNHIDEVLMGIVNSAVKGGTNRKGNVYKKNSKEHNSINFWWAVILKQYALFHIMV